MRLKKFNYNPKKMRAQKNHSKTIEAQDAPKELKNKAQKIPHGRRFGKKWFPTPESSSAK